MLQGVGVGRRAVVGPVAQVRPAPHVAADAPLLVDGVPADIPTAHAHVEQAFADVAARLREQSGRSTGTVKDVLAATAQMADDKALRSGVLQRIDAGEPVVSAIDGVVEMFATMFEQAGGYLAERVTDLRSRPRPRGRGARMGLPAPGVPALDRPSVDRRQGPRARRHGRARPGQRARDRHRARRPHRPHRDHRRAARAPVHRAGRRCDGARGRRGRGRRRRRRHRHARPVRGSACRAGAAGDRRADARVGHGTRRHRRRPRGRAAGQHRHRRGRRARRRWRRRGRRAVPDRGAVPGAHHGADAGGPGRRLHARAALVR